MAPGFAMRLCVVVHDGKKYTSRSIPGDNYRVSIAAHDALIPWEMLLTT
jgi:hypothetical protein